MSVWSKLTQSILRIHNKEALRPSWTKNILRHWQVRRQVVPSFCPATCLYWLMTEWQETDGWHNYFQIDLYAFICISLKEPDHLVIKILSHVIGLVVLKEGAEVEFRRYFLPGLAGQSGPAVHGDHQPGLLQSLLACVVKFISVLFCVKGYHNLRQILLRLRYMNNQLNVDKFFCWLNSNAGFWFFNVNSQGQRHGGGGRQTTDPGTTRKTLQTPLINN